MISRSTSHRWACDGEAVDLLLLGLLVSSYSGNSFTVPLLLQSHLKAIYPICLRILSTVLRACVGFNNKDCIDPVGVFQKYHILRYRGFQGEINEKMHREFFSGHFMDSVWTSLSSFCVMRR